MTQHYLAGFAGNDRNPLPKRLAIALAGLGCLERWSGRRLTLFAQDELPLRRLTDRSGLVIGHLFDRSGEVVTNDPDLICGSSWPEAIVERYWGSYAAFVEAKRGLSVLRDPSGGLACYHAVADGWHFYTSLPHLLVDCGVIDLEIDWQMIGASLVRRSQRPDRTALRGIGEVAPGALLTIEGGAVSSRPIWNPWRHAARAPVQNEVATLEQVLGSTLAAWGKALKRPLIEISGGLDSAIVAAGLARGEPGAALITFAAAPGDPDESEYARAIARHLDLPLEISDPRIEDVDLAVSLSRDLPRPNARAFTQAADVQSLRHARSIGADAFVSGGGGDDVFCYLRTILPAIDRLHVDGLRAMVKTASDIAIMNHSTVWDAWSRITRRLVRTSPTKPRLDRRFISRDWIAGGEGEQNRSRRRTKFPGKAEHVEGILTIHNYLEGHQRSDFAPILSPLLSQPIVECCLAIPTWRWCEDGRNRAVARRSFANRLPGIVIERRSKGSFDAFCARLLHVNRSQAQAMLMDGALARTGILDREAIDAAFRNPSPPAASVSRLLTLVDVESWATSWASRARQRF